MKKRLLAMTLAGLMTVGTMAGCGSTSSGESGSGSTASGDSDTEKWVVGYSNRDDSDVYLKAVADAFGELCEEDDSIEVVFADAKQDSQTQLDQLDNFSIQGVDAVVLVPQDGSSVVDYVEQCNDDGIPVFCSSQAATGGEYTFVGASDYELGLKTAQCAHDTLPEGAKIVYLGGILGYQTSIDRRQGLVDGLAERLKADWDGKELNADGDIEVLSWQLCDYTMEGGMTVMEDMIQTFSDIDGIVTCNDSTALGAIEALKGAGITDCLVYSIDGVDDALAAVQNGEMKCTVMQSIERHAQALYDAIKTAQAGEENPAQINPETILVTADNVEEYIK